MLSSLISPGKNTNESERRVRTPGCFKSAFILEPERELLMDSCETAPTRCTDTSSTTSTTASNRYAKELSSFQDCVRSSNSANFWCNKDAIDLFLGNYKVNSSEMLSLDNCPIAVNTDQKFLAVRFLVHATIEDHNRIRLIICFLPRIASSHRLGNPFDVYNKLSRTSR